MRPRQRGIASSVEAAVDMMAACDRVQQPIVLFEGLHEMVLADRRPNELGEIPQNGLFRGCPVPLGPAIIERDLTPVATIDADRRQQQGHNPHLGQEGLHRRARYRARCGDNLAHGETCDLGWPSGRRLDRSGSEPAIYAGGIPGLAQHGADVAIGSTDILQDQNAIHGHDPTQRGQGLFERPVQGHAAQQIGRGLSDCVQQRVVMPGQRCIVAGIVGLGFALSIELHGLAPGRRRRGAHASLADFRRVASSALAADALAGSLGPRG